MDKERQLQKEVDEKRKKEEARVKEREERLAQIKQEPDAEIRLRELTKHAAWNHEGPRPPGSDLSLYRHEKHMGYVAKDKSGWVYSPAEKTWYQKLTGLYFVYCDKTHAYVPAEGQGVTATPTEVVETPMPPPPPEPEAVPVVAVESMEETVDKEQLEAPVVPSNKGPYEESLGADRTLLFGSEAMAGRKDFMEDRHVENIIMGKLGVFFAVYDGHGGFNCAEYAAQNVHKVLQSQFKTKPDHSFDSLAAAMVDTFAHVDERYLKWADKKDMDDGSTALAIVVRGRTGRPVELLAANLGDCRAVISRGGEAVRVTRDHKPDVADERRRIEKAGGKVVEAGGCWRVTHETMFKDQLKSFLSVTRALGDRGLKAPFKLLSSKPELHKVEVGENDLFVVMACDGVWDVLSDQEVCDIVAEHMGEPKIAAGAVMREAYNRRSGDNLTCLVVMFSWNLDRAEQILAGYAEAKKKRETLAQTSTALDMFA